MSCPILRPLYTTNVGETHNIDSLVSLPQQFSLKQNKTKQKTLNILRTTIFFSGGHAQDFPLASPENYKGTDITYTLNTSYRM